MNTAFVLSLIKRFWPYVAIVALVLYGIFATVRWKDNAVNEAVQATELRLNTEYRALQTAEAEKARAKQAELQKEVDETRQAKNDQIRSIERQRDNALSELRKRPSRADPAPANTNPAATVGGSCTGVQLPREDAEFLTGEASRAQQVLTERDYYYEQYLKAQKKLEEYAKTN